ncbi:hypothetical protein BKA61DRAFT_680587 [Leptodontidium sp. MPI-SDFR-AT-0119]|nr:hypothetical protein BKA61DRAFT_680587 [Leptodontidium sp. MPI-SDFR-AT-0119]
MVINQALVVVVFLFGYGFARTDTAESCTSLQSEATVEIQYDGQVGSGIILMTTNPTSCANLGSFHPSGTSQDITTTISALSTKTSSQAPWTSATTFNTPLPFGFSRTQMINATSTGKHVPPASMGSSQILNAPTASQILPETSTYLSSSRPVAGSGIHLDVPWYHVVFWAVVTELITGFSGMSI